MKRADHAKLDYSPRDQLAIDWLLASDEPAIRTQVLRDLLGDAAAETVFGWLTGKDPNQMLTLNASRVLRVAGG